MTTHEDTPVSRPGSGQDLARRVERLEIEVSSLTATVARVELNQAHAEELIRLRFAAVDAGLIAVTTKLDTFMTRINALISGEIRLPANEALMKDYTDWRSDVDDRLDDLGAFQVQGRLLGRITLVLMGGNALAIIAAIAALAK